MEIKTDKVYLFDENNVKVGKTYRRRAAQLVNQQRAEWTDENQTGIRFKAGVELMDEAVALDDEPEAPELEKRRLYMLAEKRLRDKKLFIWHSLALIPGFILLYAFVDSAFPPSMWGYGDFSLILGVSWGAWGMFYVMHALRFVKSLRGIRRTGRDERYALRLEAEVSRLRNMGFSDKA